VHADDTGFHENKWNNGIRKSQLHM